MIHPQRAFLCLIFAFFAGVGLSWGETLPWTMTDGRRALAELAYVEGDQIFLRFGPLERRYGLEVFSKDDREYVRDWLSKERCGACNQPVTTRSKKVGKSSYHLACFQCAACSKSFRGGDRFQLDQWGTLAHVTHVTQMFDCGSCGRLFPRRGASRDQIYPDNRVACRVCRDDAILDLEELKSLRNEVTVILESVGIARPGGAVELKLVSKRELDNEAKRIHVGGNLKGLTVSRFRTVSSKKGSETTFFHAVYVLFGLPKSEIRSVIAHELMHVWLNERQVEAPADVIEGFCNLGSDHVLRQDTTRVAWILMDNMKTNPSPAYGGGYRKMIARLGQVGWPRILAEMEARGKKR